MPASGGRIEYTNPHLLIKSVDKCGADFIFKGLFNGYYGLVLFFNN